MTTYDVVAFLLRALVAALSVMLAKRRYEHRPVAAFACVIPVLDLMHVQINLGPLRHPGPYSGAERALFNLDQALFLAWPAAVASLGWMVFLGRRPWAPLVVYAVAVVALAFGYPEIRQARLGYAYAGAHLAAIVAALGCAVKWTRRRAHPRPEHAAALLLPLLDIALFAGPYAPPAPAPFSQWSIAQVVYMLLWGVLAVLHVGALGWGLLLSPSPRSFSSHLN